MPAVFHQSPSSPRSAKRKSSSRNPRGLAAPRAALGCSAGPVRPAVIVAFRALRWRARRHTEQLARPCDFGVTPVSSAELGCRVARGSFLPVRVLSPVSAIATGGDDGSPRREGAAGEGEPGRVCFSASEDCLPSHEPTPLGSLQRAFSGELSAGEVPQAELAVEQLHDEAVAMPGQCRVVARPLVAQEGMLRVELVPLVEDGGLFEAATD